MFSFKQLSTKVTYLEKKCHKSITFLEFELTLKKFVLNYQYQAILSNIILIKKAKLLTNRLGIPENDLQFLNSFKVLKNVIEFSRKILRKSRIC